MNKDKSVSDTGTAGREALTGVPLIVESLLLNRNLNSDSEDDYEREPTGYELMKKFLAAYAIVRDGHVHIGLIHPEALTFVGPLIAAASEIVVVYQYGAAWIHTKATGATSIIMAREDFTSWSFVEDHPSKIRRASFYRLSSEGLVLVATKKARGGYEED